MTNKILKIALALSIGTFTFLQADTKYEKNYNNNTINVPSSKNDKIFIREYKYNASDTDSKVSSRKKAIAQLKSILSEEVGVHIQSNFEIKQNSHNKYVKREINQLSSSITKLKILKEKWNGVTYYIKASVKINEEQTMLLLLEAIKAKASQKDVKRLNKILKEQNGNLDKSYSKIQQLQKKLVLQEIKNQASKDELLHTKKTLQKLQKEKQQFDNQIVEQKSEINKINKLVQKAKDRIKNSSIKACMMTKGMTINEVVSAIGKPTGKGQIYRYETYPKSWYYGSIELQFGTKSGILKWISGCTEIKKELKLWKELDKIEVLNKFYSKSKHTYDYKKARDNGYSDNEIINYLKKQDAYKLKIIESLKAGYSSTEIINYLLKDSKFKLPKGFILDK
jgi:hypothetical protein